MSLLNPAAATADLPAPLFDTKGKFAGIDLSAWISGAVLAIGISRIGSSEISADFANGGFGLHLIVACYMAFIGIVLWIQGGMRVALSASSFDTPASLVTGGIFKFTRNPIYLAFFLPLLSLSYFSTHTAVAATVIYVTVMNLMVIRREERNLQDQFGADFDAYRAAVPRWIA